MTTLRILVAVIALDFSLGAMDIQTLDGKTYRGCTVSLIEPDAVCLLFPGGGARVKFTNLPEHLRTEYGYDPVKAAAFEQAQVAKRLRENARWQAARLHADTQRKAVASNAVARIHAAAGSSARETLAYGGRNQGTGGYGGNNNGQNTYTGTEYIGVNLASAGYGSSGRGGGGGYGGGSGGQNQGGWGGTGATYIGVRLVP